MATLLQQTITQVYNEKAVKPSPLSRFISWCNGQEKNRFGWLAAALAIHGCVSTPLTLFAIILAGNNIVFWVMAIVAMMMALVTNLAAMPTKITIPTLVLSLVIDVTIIISCAAIGFNMAGTYV